MSLLENYVEYLHKKKAKESSVHRNPYETHDAYDAIRTQDADLAVSFVMKTYMLKRSSTSVCTTYHYSIISEEKISNIYI